MMSKHQLVYQDLCEQIDRQRYLAGSLLPSEAQLVELYGASRDTIRKALQLLQDNGLIQKIKGKGSVVLDPGKFVFPVSGIASYAELNAKQKMKSITKIVAHEQQKIHTASFDHSAAAGEQLQVTYLGRLRIVDGVPSILDKDYVLTDIVKSVPAQLPNDSLYAYLEGELGLQISYARKEFTAEPATAEDQKLLALKATDLVIVIRSMTYLSDTRLVQLTESRHRADRFLFVDFARRNLH